MDWKLIMPAVVGGLIVAVGWVVSHYLNKSRDIAAEKRKTRVAFLIEAYRRLERVSERRSNQDKSAIEDIESAIADIQLMGTPGQIRLAQDFAFKMASGDGASVKSLLVDLRGTLRSELDLEQVETDLRFLRIKP